MSIQDAMRECTPHQCFRAVTWQEKGLAIYISNGRFWSTYGQPWVMMPDDLVLDWELVSVSKIAEEKKKGAK